MRDYGPMFNRDSTCAICGQPRTIAGRDVHTEIHLARAEAIVEVDYRRGKRVERVIPNTGHDESSVTSRGSEMHGDTASPAVPRSVFTRKLDPKLEKLVRAHLKPKGAT